MPFDSIISRTDADALIPEEVASQVISAATKESAALSLFRRVQLSSKVAKMPVLSALPIAYFVSGDTGLKQTTEAAWQGVMLEAEEIACIVPIPENVVDDADFNVWGELRPAIAEAVAQVLDARRRRGSLHYKRTSSLADVAELLGDSKRVAADHYVYALTDYREVDRTLALARANAS